MICSSQTSMLPKAFLPKQALQMHLLVWARHNAQLHSHVACHTSLLPSFLEVQQSSAVFHGCN